MKVDAYYEVMPGNVTEHQIVAVVEIDTEKGPHESFDGTESCLTLTPSQLRSLADRFTMAAAAIDKMHGALKTVMVPDWNTRDR
jgi:hypothetical protein